jgi:hypothetical protein
VTEPIRIANCSGYAGDRREAIREILDGEPVDVIAGDYLAEVTIAGMAARRMQGRGEGYSEYLLLQLEDCLDELLARGIKLVVNAGGFDPAALAAKLRELASPRRPARAAHLEGDDLLGRLGELQAAGHPLSNLDTGAPLSHWGHDNVLSASAYVGAWGITAALAAGADIVVCPRVTDASLIVGPAAWWHGWQATDWDRLANAVVAGHIIECGPQATGGNFSGFASVPGMTHPGFPIAEIAQDGSAVITKAPGTGGAVSTDTVTAQLLYEIQGPIYLNPDVTVDLREVRLTEVGEDRVGVGGAVGSPPPPTLKVAITAADGWENSFEVFVCGLDPDAKAELIEAQVRDVLANSGVELYRFDLIGRPAVNPETIEAATCALRIVGRASRPDPLKGPNFWMRVHSTILASIPGFHAEGSTGRGTRPSPVIHYWPALLDAAAVTAVVVHDDGTRVDVAHVETGEPPRVPSLEAGVLPPQWADAELVSVPLGRLADARAGDKGGNSNVGFWTDEETYPWFVGALSVDRMRQLYPEARELDILRHEFPYLRAVHFVIKGNLGEGCTSNGRLDALGKSVAEFLRAREIDAPRTLVEGRAGRVAGVRENNARSHAEATLTDCEIFG